MKLRELYSQNTPRTILWRSLLAIFAGLLGSALIAVFTGHNHFMDLAIIAIAVPLTFALANLLAYWFVADTQRKLREVEQPTTKTPSA